MIFSDLIRLALRNLSQARMRTSLTTLGVAIGIASLGGMLSLGVGLQEQFSERLLRSGMFDAITVFPKGSLRGMRRGGANPPSTDPDEQAVRLPLDEDALKQFLSLDKVVESYPNLRIPVQVKFDDRSEFTVAAGIPLSARGTGIFQSIVHGEFFTAADEDACLISLEFARRLSTQGEAELIGKKITIAYAEQAAADSVGAPGITIRRSESTLRIAGIVEREPGPGFGGSMFSSLMIPLEKARKMGGGPDSFNPQGFLRRLEGAGAFSSATVKVERPQDLEEVAKKIRDMGFSVFSINDAIQGMKRAFIILDIILGLIGSIALAVASLGIVNTMVMSILERTREIGVMKAIGGSDNHIRRIFLVEASVIGAAGGLFGILLGWAVSRAINFGAGLYMESQGAPAANLFTFPWWLLAGAVAFSILISLLAGSYPASRAARLDPVRALRHD